MKKAIAITLLCVFSVFTGFSQNNGQIVILKKKFYQDDKQLSKKELKYILKNDPGSAGMYRKSRTNLTIGAVLIGVGTASVLTGVLVRFASRVDEAEKINNGKSTSTNSSLGLIPTLVGAGLVIVSLPFEIIGNKQFKKSINLYNSKNKTSSSIQPRLDFGISPTNVSVSVRF